MNKYNYFNWILLHLTCLLLVWNLYYQHQIMLCTMSLCLKNFKFHTVKLDVCLLISGVGIGQMISVTSVFTYYTSIMAITMFYFFASFSAELPWARCDPSWVNCNDAYGSNGTISSSEIYFKWVEKPVLHCFSPQESARSKNKLRSRTIVIIVGTLFLCCSLGARREKNSSLLKFANGLVMFPRQTHYFLRRAEQKWSQFAQENCVKSFILKSENCRRRSFCSLLLLKMTTTWFYSKKKNLYFQFQSHLTSCLFIYSSKCFNFAINWSMRMLNLNKIIHRVAL